MIGDLKPYTEYKDSGLPWLGQVPQHWELIPNRGLIRRRKMLVGDRHREYRLLSLTKQGIIIRDLSTGKGKFSSDMGSSQEVRLGDLVFCLFDVPETPRTVGLSKYDGMITGAYTVFEPIDRGRSTFFEFFYRAMDERKLLSPLYSGLRNTIPAERFLGVKTPQPPPEEQAAIVRFLNWVNGRLELAIRAKRKVIALLNEQKQAIIHRAVTRGLDPNVPLKPSGIPWLGDIPAHWEVMAIKHVLHRLVDCEHKTAPYVEDSDFRVVRTSAVRNGEIRWNGTYCTTADAYDEWTQRATPEVGDVIFTREAPVGEACLVPEAARVCLGQRTVLMKVRSQVYDSRFMIHMIYTGPPRLCIDLASQGSTVGHFNMDDIGWMKVLVPPLEEQRQIVDSIAKETVNLSLTIERTEHEIELLREYRTRLVADVVTGKLDVREVAAKLPDEAPLSDSALDEETNQLDDDLPFDEDTDA